MLKRVLYTTHTFERDGLRRLQYLPVGEAVFNTARDSDVIAEVRIAGLEQSGPFVILRGRPPEPPSGEVRR